MIMSKEKNLVCYVFVRHLPRTMNPGKMAAQVHHAGVQMMAQWKRGSYADTLKSYNRNERTSTTDAFGTTIVLEAINKENTSFQIQSLVDRATKMGLIAGAVTDTTYPVDHEVTISLLTVGYILGDKDELSLSFPEIKNEWQLHD